MNYKEFNVALPIHDNNVVIIDGIVQYDTANIVNVRLMDGTEPFDFTGYTNVFVEIMKPDGTHVQACACGDPLIDNDNNPYRIQIIDPVEGRISFTLKGQATILTGTHFAQITIMGAGDALTTARLNYYVKDTVSSDEDSVFLESLDDYASLRNLIAKCSAIATAEEMRVDAETLRKLAEIQRENDADELEREITEYLSNAEEYVQKTQDYMEEAERFAQLAQNPSAEIMEELITGLGLATENYVTETVENATGAFNAGTYSNLDKLLQIRRGNDSAVPTLEDGELGWSSDAQTLYVGSPNGNVPINGVYVASTTAPGRTDILWIDISAGSVVKYYNGTAWTPTATAAFA